MPSCALSRLRLAVSAVLCFSVRSLAEQQLLCSSDAFSLWWEYEGPLYHFSISIERCISGMKTINFNYTLITKFTIAYAGYDATMYYKNQLWLDLYQPPIPCTGLRVCGIVKGEMLTESLSLPIEPYYVAEGEYRAFIHVNIIDDLEREITITVNVTIRVGSSDNGSDLIHHAKVP